MQTLKKNYATALEYGIYRPATNSKKNDDTIHCNIHEMFKNIKSKI